MNIKIQLSLNDYKDAQWLHMRPKTLFRYIGIFVLVFLIMCLIGIIIKAVNRGSFDGGNIIYLVCLGYLLFLFFYYYPNRFKKLYNQHKLIREPMVFGIEDSGIKLKTPSIDANLNWDSFIKWKEGKKLFILYQNDALMNILPKRFFDNENDISQFKSVVSSKIEKQIK